MSSIYCKLCDELVESKSRHDWKACKGGHVFIDGGQDYVRYGTLRDDVTEADYVVGVQEP